MTNGLEFIVHVNIYIAPSLKLMFEWCPRWSSRLRKSFRFISFQRFFGMRNETTSKSSPVAWWCSAMGKVKSLLLSSQHTNLVRAIHLRLFIPFETRSILFDSGSQALAESKCKQQTVRFRKQRVGDGKLNFHAHHYPSECKSKKFEIPSYCLKCRCWLWPKRVMESRFINAFEV